MVLEYVLTKAKKKKTISVVVATFSEVFRINHQHHQFETAHKK